MRRGGKATIRGLGAWLVVGLGVEIKMELSAENEGETSVF